MISWVYLHSEETCWTVGFYTPEGKWEAESDHDTPESAANRVAFLNGYKRRCAHEWHRWGRDSAGRDLMSCQLCGATYP